MVEQIQTDPFTLERQKMVASQLRVRGIRDERVLEAMARVPRHEFVPENCWREAYEDHPIAIGEGQTISQPYIVAATLDALHLQPSDRVLDVGTGSGYQAALLGELSQQVYSIERHEVLADSARAILTRLGYKSVRVLLGDGSKGFPEAAPFAAIAVSAAAPRLPQALLDQLAEGGRMVIPVGPPHAQELQLVSKRGGNLQREVLDGCRFVPLVGEQGYKLGW